MLTILMDQVVETKKCQKCSNEFHVTDKDLDFYKQMAPMIGTQRVEIPTPTLCPVCRAQRRFSWRNERNLYWGKCDATGKDILRVFSADKDYKVYSEEEWYKDGWTGLDYGRDFDFSRPFFEQFQELMREVPQLARSVTANQNCDYVNQCGWCKNCYLIFEATRNEDCAYANYLNRCKSSLDNLQVRDSELMYECINCKNSYDLRYSQDSDNCTESWFLKSCIGCKNCFGCVNLRNKQYHIWNQAYSKEEYYQKLEAMKLEERNSIQVFYKQFLEYVIQFPVKYLHGVQNENSVGDYLDNAQNCYFCFDVQEAQDCKYCFNIHKLKNCQDITVFGGEKGLEFCYENHETGDGSRNLLFVDQIWGGCYEIMYSKMCTDNCHHLFGCVGLRHADYVVFNKKYSKEEYEELVLKIIKPYEGDWRVGRILPSLAFSIWIQ